MKAKNRGSVVFSAADSSLELGVLFFPLLFVMFLGFPLESAQLPNTFVAMLSVLLTLLQTLQLQAGSHKVTGPLHLRPI